MCSVMRLSSSGLLTRTDYEVQIEVEKASGYMK